MLKEHSALFDPEGKGLTVLDDGLPSAALRRIAAEPPKPPAIGFLQVPHALAANAGGGPGGGPPGTGSSRASFHRLWSISEGSSEERSSFPALSPAESHLSGHLNPRFGGRGPSLHRNSSTGHEERFRMKLTFDKFDITKEGSVPESCIKPLLASIGHHLGEEQCRELLAQVDVNGNQKLEFQEFLQLVEMFKHMAQFRRAESTGTFRRDPLESSAHRLLLRPNRKWRWAWDVVLCLILCYIIAATTSLWIGPTWIDSAERGAAAFSVTDVIVAVIIAVDAAVSLNTPFEASDAAAPQVRTAPSAQRSPLVTDRIAIARRYLWQHGWMDVLAVLPLRMFFSPQSQPIAAVVLAHLRLVYAGRYYFLFKPTKGHMTEHHVRFFFTFVPLLLNACALALFIHITTVLTMRIVPSLRSSYVGSMYMTLYIMSGVGYGDIIVLGNISQWWVAILCTLAMVVNGFVIGGFVKFLSESDAESTRRDRLVQTQAVLNFFDVPTSLQEEILQYQNYIMSRVIRVAYSGIMAAMPEELQFNVGMMTTLPTLQSVPLLAESHFAARISVAQLLRSTVHSPEAFIVVSSEKGDTLHFINYGFADVMARSGVYLDTIGSMQHFGSEAVVDTMLQWTRQGSNRTARSPREGSLLDDTNSGGSGHYENSVKSLTYLETLSLTLSDMLLVAESFPRFGKSIKQAMELRDPIALCHAFGVHPSLVDHVARRMQPPGEAADVSPGAAAGHLHPSCRSPSAPAVVEYRSEAAFAFQDPADGGANVSSAWGAVFAPRRSRTHSMQSDVAGATHTAAAAGGSTDELRRLEDTLYKEMSELHVAMMQLGRLDKYLAPSNHRRSPDRHGRIADHGQSLPSLLVTDCE